jgi:hypothetical protein
MVLLNTEKVSGRGQIHALNGIRTLSMTWVFLGHCIDFGGYMLPYSNILDIYRPVSEQRILHALRISIVR